MLAEAGVDVVLTDLGMPEESGYDLLRQLRANPHTARIPVIAVTAYSRAEDREQALAAGFDLHVGKPVEPTALIGAVSAAARMRAGSEQDAAA